MPTISVIIPALNERVGIAACVRAARAALPGAEIIVADGGSADGTAELAQAAGARVVRGARGRGSQCNAGAALASGELLLFLHADTALPADALAQLGRAFADPRAQIAKFRLSFDTRHWLLDIAARLMWHDSVWSSFGDQGIVLRRGFFAELGGFPGWPLFEDVRIFELARQRAVVYVIPAEVITSARRFIDNGVLWQLLSDVWMLTRYLLGASPAALYGEYEGGGAALRGATGLPAAG